MLEVSKCYPVLTKFCTKTACVWTCSRKSPHCKFKALNFLSDPTKVNFTWRFSQILITAAINSLAFRPALCIQRLPAISIKKAAHNERKMCRPLCDMNIMDAGPPAYCAHLAGQAEGSKCQAQVSVPNTRLLNLVLIYLKSLSVLLSEGNESCIATSEFWKV